MRRLTFREHAAIAIRAAMANAGCTPTESIERTESAVETAAALAREACKRWDHDLHGPRCRRCGATRGKD